jgi:sulfoxide reductase heme-binding subunit YedZ
MTAQQALHLVAATVGFISFFLVWLSIVLGLILRNSWASTRMRHSTVLAAHHTAALLGLCLAVVHALAQLAVPGSHVRLIDELLPFLNRVDPLGLGVGVIGLELLLAAAASIVIQRRLGFSRWRALHVTTYVALMLVVGHVLISGTDTAPPYVWGPVMLAWLSVVVMWLISTSWVRARMQVHSRSGGNRPVTDLTVGVDATRCGRFGFCEQEAPDVFSLRGDGRLSYAAWVPADELDAVVRAMNVCPARAISVSHQPTLMITAVSPPVSLGRTNRRSTASGRGRRSSKAIRGGLHRQGGFAGDP